MVLALCGPGNLVISSAGRLGIFAVGSVWFDEGGPRVY